MSMLDPIHPGEILEEEFMKPLELSANALARALDVPENPFRQVGGNRQDFCIADIRGGDDVKPIFQLQSYHRGQKQPLN